MLLHTMLLRFILVHHMSSISKQLWEEGIRSEFSGPEDDSRWVARLRMTATETDDDEGNGADLLLGREVDCIQLVRERTPVPVPKIFGYMSSSRKEIGALFMLMECLSGNVAMDLKFDSIPAPYKSSFYSDTAR